MPVDIKISKVDLKRLEVLVKDFPVARQKAFRRGISRTVTSTRANVSKELRTVVNLKAGSIKSRVSFKRPTSQDQTGSVTIAGRKVSLASFNPRVTKRRGVSVKVFKKKKPTQFRHAFIGKGRGAVDLVMFRSTAANSGDPRFGKGSGQKDRRWGQPDNPVTVMSGPSLVNIMENEPGMMDRVLRKAEADQLKNVSHEIDYYLKHGKPNG